MAALFINISKVRRIKVFDVLPTDLIKRSF
jgi:hypothetical protein